MLICLLRVFLFNMCYWFDLDFHSIWFLHRWSQNSEKCVALTEPCLCTVISILFLCTVLYREVALGGGLYRKHDANDSSRRAQTFHATQGDRVIGVTAPP